MKVVVVWLAMWLAMGLGLGCASDPIGDAAPTLPDELVAKQSSVIGLKTAAEPWWSDPVRFPYDSQRLADWTQYQWRNQFNLTQAGSESLVREVERQGAQLFNWEDGNGYAVSDFHGVEVRLPSNDPRRSPQALLQLIRDNPAIVGGGPGTTDFSDEVGWPGVQPNTTRQVGEVVFLDLWGPDNAAIAYIDVDISDRQFCVMTVTHPHTGWHPVNGIRCWGYIDWPRGDYYTHLFYTTGVDSPSVAGSGWVGAPLQYEVWNAMMVAIARHVECLWDRDAGYIWQDDEVQEGLSGPGNLGLSDIDHLGRWDTIEKATPQFELACPAGGAQWTPDEAAGWRDTDGDGVVDAEDRCSDTPRGKAVWREGEWKGCAGGQRLD